jgi:hypothetical protein
VRAATSTNGPPRCGPARFTNGAIQLKDVLATNFNTCTRTSICGNPVVPIPVPCVLDIVPRRSRRACNASPRPPQTAALIRVVTVHRLPLAACEHACQVKQRLRTVARGRGAHASLVLPLGGAVRIVLLPHPPLACGKLPRRRWWLAAPSSAVAPQAAVPQLRPTTHHPPASGAARGGRRRWSKLGN